jgi:hypothetical protein
MQFHRNIWIPPRISANRRFDGHMQYALTVSF